ncbi:hypothetical protein EYF80_002532 [Liparis tanakae]|uniref:Uncharacterized protein n=1 Tax=Liparis tanakae TaxID=230148 RepID=A0A4Z2JBF6_9TELE|nr:hypothetical protein EYF80_002532 [Liparis tanakae]
MKQIEFTSRRAETRVEPVGLGRSAPGRNSKGPCSKTTGLESRSKRKTMRLWRGSGRLKLPLQDFTGPGRIPQDLPGVHKDPKGNQSTTGSPEADNTI